MPFDLTTAKPVQPANTGGFDLSTAQPMQSQPSVMDNYGQTDPQAALKQTMGEESWLGRQAAGFSAAPVKGYYGVKQLLQGGTLSPEDQQAVRDWSTIEQEAPVGAIAGNIATMALPAAGMAKIPMLAGAGRAILAPRTALQAGTVGATYAGLQPTAGQGVEGLQERGIEAMKGAGAGVLGYGAAKGIGRVLAPQTSPEIQLLQKEGIPTTLGQTLGGRAQTTESKMTSVIGMGDLIASKQSQGIDALNVAAYNRALKPIGAKSSGNVGFKGVEEVHKKLSEKYADLTGKMNFKPDPQFAQDLTKIRSMVDELPEQYAGMYDKMVNRIIASRATPQGNMSGETLKSVESELTKQINKLRSGQPSYEHIEVADALEAAQKSIRDNLARQSPEWAKELSKVNEGWANYAIIRDAASTATGRKGGAFTPANLASAVSSNAKKMSGQAAGRGKISEGRALMQDLSSAAENRLAPAYPDSGTAGRIIPSALALGAAGGGAAATGLLPVAGLAALGSTPYLSTRLTNAILTQRPELVRQLGGKLSDLAPYGALAGIGLSQ